MRNIGIVCEGPTDYIILKAVIDKITEEENSYYKLQPDDDLTGRYGNGWKGVWKWCFDNAGNNKKIMKGVEPSLDLLLIQIDGDVSRKEKITHCICKSTVCENKRYYKPINCDQKRELRDSCPISLPCQDHNNSIEGYIDHLKHFVEENLQDLSKVCIVVPCDSTDAWVIAAYDKFANSEKLRIPGKV